MKTATVQLMLRGRKCNIRSVLKTNDHSLINELKINLSKAIVYLATNYTGAKFENPLTEQQLATVKDCTRFIFEEFPMFSLDEIRKAFQMAAAKKLNNVSLKAYFGLFNNQILGSVLHAYKIKRRAVLCQHDKEEASKIRQQKAADFKKKNEDARKKVIKDYIRIKADFQESGDIEALNSSVMSYWGKILDAAGLLNFSIEEKIELVKESKQLVRNEIRAEANDSQSPTERRSLITLLQDVSQGIDNTSFTVKWQTKYAKLIVIKSIINEK